MVTDGAVVIARVTNDSVYREIHEPCGTRLRLIAHFLSNAMKSVMATYSEPSVLKVVVDGFRSMKKIIEYSNRFGWNHLLPCECNLIQKWETRF